MTPGGPWAVLHGLLLEAPRFYTYYNVLLLGQALLATVGLSVLGGAAGFLAGGVLAVLRTRRLVDAAPLRILATLYVEVFRRIPFLVKLLCIFFGLQYLGLQTPMFVVALLTVTVSASAFAAELVRAGLKSVHPNQVDAAEAMNLSRAQVLFSVMLPQSWRVIVPPAVGYLAGFVKSTSIASQVGVLELTYAAKLMNTKGFSALICFGTVLVLYFLVCYPLSLGAPGWSGGWTTGGAPSYPCKPSDPRCSLSTRPTMEARMPPKSAAPDLTIRRTP